MIAKVVVLKHKGTGSHIIQPFVNSPSLGTVANGEPIAVQRDKPASAIASAVIRGLEVSQLQKYNDSQTVVLSSEEQKRLSKEHLFVNISLNENGQMRIQPMHRKGSGHVGFRKEEILIPKKEIGSRLASALEEAFTIAT